MADDTGKTEKPTPKKIREARKEGNFPRTPDAATWVSIAAATALLPRTMTSLADQFHTLIAFLPEVAADPRPERAAAVLELMIPAILVVVVPFALAASFGAVVGAASQGVFPSAKPMKPSLKKLNPISGVKRMFGPRALWEALKALLKVVVITGAVWVVAKQLVPQLIGAGTLPLMVVVDRTRTGLLILIWTAVAAGLVLAVADYAYSRHTVMKKLKMTPREVKDEAKQAEGDPMIKGAIRSKQMQMSRNRMLTAVSDADVVLVNPTHVAVALKYEPAKGAPRVVAKGTGVLAGRIRDRARENRVPVVEDKPLTRLLYRICDLDDEIPAELYEAVARILAFVMAVGKPSRTAGTRRPTHRVALPEVPSKPVLRARRSREKRQARVASR